MKNLLIFVFLFLGLFSAFGQSRTYDPANLTPYVTTSRSTVGGQTMPLVRFSPPRPLTALEHVALVAEGVVPAGATIWGGVDVYQDVQLYALEWALDHQTGSPAAAITTEAFRAGYESGVIRYRKIEQADIDRLPQNYGGGYQQRLLGWDTIQKKLVHVELNTAFNNKVGQIGCFLQLDGDPGWLIATMDCGNVSVVQKGEKPAGQPAAPAQPEEETPEVGVGDTYVTNNTYNTYEGDTYYGDTTVNYNYYGDEVVTTEDPVYDDQFGGGGYWEQPEPVFYGLGQERPVVYGCGGSCHPGYHDPHCQGYVPAQGGGWFQVAASILSGITFDFSKDYTYIELTEETYVTKVRKEQQKPDRPDQPEDPGGPSPEPPADNPGGDDPGGPSDEPCPGCYQVAERSDTKVSDPRSTGDRTSVSVREPQQWDEPERTTGAKLKRAGDLAGLTSPSTPPGDRSKGSQPATRPSTPPGDRSKGSQPATRPSSNPRVDRGGGQPATRPSTPPGDRSKGSQPATRPSSNPRVDRGGGRPATRPQQRSSRPAAPSRSGSPGQGRGN